VTTSTTADRLASLVGLFEGADVARTRRLIDVVRDRDPETDPVVVALVGSSGVGKSYLVNAWARSDIAPSGVLRPTTSEPLVVGGGADHRLRGFPKATLDSAAASGVVLVDTPPWEHDHDAVDAVLDVSDIAVLVVSPSRYADASTVEIADRVTTRGVALAVAINRVPAGGESIVAAASGTGWEVPIVIPEEAGAGSSIGSLTAFLRGTMSRRAEIFEQRRAGAVPEILEAVEGIAEGADERHRAEAELLESARLQLSPIGIDASRVANVADRTWPEAETRLAAAVDTAVAAAIARFRGRHEADERALGRIAGAAAAIRTTDPGVFDTWELAVTVDAVDAIRPRLLRRFWRASVAREMWRLALDLDREPSRRTRRALGSRLSLIRELARDGIDDVLGEATTTRTAEFLDALAGHTIEPGDRLREAAAELAAAAVTIGDEPPLAAAGGIGEGRGSDG
jgi:GTPase Era involved in 16S rRNA processing